ncbi:uncharacterized protein LOC111711681 isoform X1 [Eurytemora carolleeae]|uniref:uncharacterized protein LOC111711681 isoform X1 n=1 Tax=Eurytemora carolleeae TaxID=1294199 RepID=UPI000C7597A6|nr:uncharacterized protein LOC111711681 isoform X1 [Eurytemora carolleeae]|eukprot:XP_023341845.1 uncharacterized protein LOC111711681 isoform X1 [Eurytemora affinis]
MYSVARYGKEFACFSSVSNALLSKCAKFLKYEVSRNYRILSEFQKDDFELFQMLVGWGSGEGSLEEEDSKELQDDDFWGWGGVFPLEELPQEDDRVQDLPMTSSARQKGIISCTTRMTAAPKELTCFSSYDRYSRCKHEETMDLFVGEVFEKYMLKSTEPFLFYCSIPPYTRYRTFSFLLFYTIHIQGTEPSLFYCSIPTYTRCRTFPFLLLYTTKYKVRNLLFSTALYHPYTRYRIFSFLLLYTNIYKVQNLLFSTALCHHIQGAEPSLFYCSIPPYTRYRTFAFTTDLYQHIQGTEPSLSLLLCTTIYKVQNLLFSTALYHHIQGTEPSLLLLIYINIYKVQNLRFHYCSVPPYTRYRTFSFLLLYTTISRYRTFFFLLLYTTIYKVRNLSFSTALYHYIQGTEPSLYYCSVSTYTRYRTFSFIYCSIPSYSRYRTFSFLLLYTTIYKV